jgi:hypothetical protein
LYSQAVGFGGTPYNPQVFEAVRNVSLAVSSAIFICSNPKSFARTENNFSEFCSE